MMNEPNPPATDMTAIEREAQAWAVRLGSGRVTTADADAFRYWCAQSRVHATAFVQAREVWRAVAPAAEAARAAGAAQAWTNNQANNRAKAHGKASAWQPGRRALLAGTAMAAVGWLAVRPPLGLWPGVTEFAADLRTGTGEQREVALGGNATLQMNTQTRINLRPAAADVASFQLVAGEAEVTVDSSATAAVRVAAGRGVVTASRARFNLRHTGRDACVTCLSGQVAVSEGVHRVTLQAGQQLTYGPAGFGEPLRTDAREVTGWRQRVLVFNQVPLAMVVDEVNRYRPGRIVLTERELGQTLVQANFSLQRLDDVVPLIRDVYGAQVTELPGGIVLLGRATA